MPRNEDPGPPLLAEEEFCPYAAPTRGEILRAILVGALMVLTGSVAQLAAALITQRVWGLVTVGVGIITGFAVHEAAGRHRSVLVGAVAAGSTLGASLIGYGFYWIPLLPRTVDRTVTLYHLIMLGLGLFIAYLLSGPRIGSDDPEHF